MNRNHKFSLPSLLSSLLLLTPLASFAEVEWWISSTFCRSGLSETQAQIIGCDTANETTVGSTYGTFSTMKKGSTYSFVFANSPSTPYGTRMNRHCFSNQTGCSVIIAFDADPPGNWTLCSGSLENCLPSPLILDIGGDGIRLGEKGELVEFDINADGESDSIQWVRRGGDESFLALDLNGNGLVDNGSELFGDATILEIAGDNATDGFLALAQYDRLALGGNGDFKITEADEIWGSLVLWLDSNADGVSVPEELISLSKTNLRSIGLVAKSKQIYDEAGNSLPLWSKVGVKSGKTIDIVDVFFAI